MNGDGRDTISNFGFMTSYNADTADKINFLDSKIRNVMTHGEDILISVGETDYLQLNKALGKDFVVVGNDTTFTVQVGDTVLTYDGRADYFNVQVKNATLTFESSLQSAEVWLNNGRHKSFGRWRS